MSLITEVKFIANTVRESLLHPRSISVINKRTGQVLARGPFGSPVAGRKPSK